MGRCERSDTGLVEQLRRELPGQRLDLPRELALLGGQLLHPARDSTHREQSAAQLWIGATFGSHRREQQDDQAGDQGSSGQDGQSGGEQGSGD